MKDEIEQISSERIDDIPVVVEWLRQMQIVKWIDKKLSQPHGNHQGLSYGQPPCTALNIHNYPSRSPIMCRRRMGEGPSTDLRNDDRLVNWGENPLWLKQWVLNQHQPSEEIFLPTQKEDEVTVDVGKGFEVELGKFWLNPDTKKSVHWHERYLVVYSNSFAAAQIRGQQQRLKRAETALEQLASNPGADLAQLNLKVKAILTRHQVGDFLAVTLTEQVLVHTRYVQRGRPSAKSQTKQLTEIQFQLDFVRLSAPIEQAQLLAGWRLYVTNVPLQTLSLSQAVFYYRQEWLVEHGFHRFKRGRLPALPIYFQNQDRIAGLMFLLSLALRVFTLIEFVVRQALAQTHQSLSGLYEGNPRRETKRPSTEQLLKAFRHLTLYCLPDLTFFITPLSELQRRILSLMNLSASLYQLYLKPCKT